MTKVYEGCEEITSKRAMLQKMSAQVVGTTINENTEERKNAQSEYEEEKSNFIVLLGAKLGQKSIEITEAKKEANEQKKIIARYEFNLLQTELCSLIPKKTKKL